MLLQLIIGTITIIFIVIVSVELLEVFSKCIQKIKTYFEQHYYKLSRSIVIACSVLCVMFTMTFQVWIWAFVLQLTGALSGIEPSIYFALVCFTTLGFGDIILSEEWRILSAMIAANGLLMFSWGAAYLLDVFQTMKKNKFS